MPSPRSGLVEQPHVPQVVGQLVSEEDTRSSSCMAVRGLASPLWHLRRSASLRGRDGMPRRCAWMP